MTTTRVPPTQSASENRMSCEGRSKRDESILAGHGTRDAGLGIRPRFPRAMLGE
jgi:hypothetical protein